MRPFALVTLCAVISATACGGDDDDGESDAAAPTTISVPAGVDVEEDVAVVNDAVLQLADLPPGWREETDGEDESEEEQFDIEECGAIQATGQASEAARTAKATSGPFVDGEAEIESSVSASTSEDVSRAAFDPFEDAEQANACLEAAFSKAFEETAPSDEDVEVGEVRAGRTSLGEEFGDESISYQVEIELEVDGLSPSVYADFTAARVGRYTAAFFFLDVLSPVDPAIQVDAVRAVVQRLEAAAN
jgi:hypothetical protein